MEPSYRSAAMSVDMIDDEVTKLEFSDKMEASGEEFKCSSDEPLFRRSHAVHHQPLRRRTSSNDTTHAQNRPADGDVHSIVSDVDSVGSEFEKMTVPDAVRVALESSKRYLDLHFPGLKSLTSPLSVRILRRTGYVHDERCILHKHPRSHHPECPERVMSIVKAFQETGLENAMHLVPGRRATKEEILYVHSQHHLDNVLALQDPAVRMQQHQELAHNSAFANEHTPEAALVSAGSLVELVQNIAHGNIINGVAVLRPPGHHAECSKITGFCVFNNVAIAAAWLSREAPRVRSTGRNRVMIVDWDVHHGNGSQHMFEDDPDVFFVSVHRWDCGNFYPYGPDAGPDSVGRGAGKGTTINVGWNGEGPFGDAEYLAVWNTIVMPAARCFNPDYILVSAGFDAAQGDPLGGCMVTSVGYAHMLHSLMSLANGRIAVALEGGYNLRALAECSIAVASVLVGAPPPQLLSLDPPSTCALNAIRATIVAHKRLKGCKFAQWTSTIITQLAATDDLHHINGKHLTTSSHETAATQHDNMHLYAPTSPAPMLFPSGCSSPGFLSHHPHSSPTLSSLSKSPDAQMPDFRQVSADIASSFDGTDLSGQSHVLSAVSKTSPSTNIETSASATTQVVRPDVGQGGCFQIKPLKFSPNVEFNVNSKGFRDDSVDLGKQCEECGTGQECWVCLQCFRVFCGRYVQGHMLKHSETSGHLIAIGVQDLSVWDFGMENYLDSYVIPALQPIYAALHLQKFNKPAEFPSSETAYHGGNDSDILLMVGSELSVDEQGDNLAGVKRDRSSM